MDEGTGGVSPPDPARRAALEVEAAALRQRLDELLDELDLRRRRTAGAVALLRRYAVPTLVAAAVISGGVYAAIVWRERRIAPWYARAARARASRLIRLLPPRW
jgi:hypothetical protein